uniref:Clip domain-containing protein n=1 Tax=Rhipicephalus pulchellus TaxID=72859 RepID=L7M8I4_RHIPC
MYVLPLALGLMALGSNLGCEAHLLGTVERGPCQAKNPLGRGFLDGTCMPTIKCKQILRGIVRLNFPVICGFELLRPIVCCPHMGHSAPGSGGKGPGPGSQVPHQPLPPHGGGGSGFPVRPDNYPPDVGPQQPHGNSPGTGPVPPQPGSGGGAVPQGPVIPSRPTNPTGPAVPSKPVVPSGPAVPPTPINKPGKQPATGGGSNPPGEGSNDGAPCDDECEPGENDSYIHLIDPRRGKN